MGDLGSMGHFSGMGHLRLGQFLFRSMGNIRSMGNVGSMGNIRGLGNQRRMGNQHDRRKRKPARKWRTVESVIERTHPRSKVFMPARTSPSVAASCSPPVNRIFRETTGGFKSQYDQVRGEFLPLHATYYLNGHCFMERELTRATVGFREDDNALPWRGRQPPTGNPQSFAARLWPVNDWTTGLPDSPARAEVLNDGTKPDGLRASTCYSPYDSSSH